MKTMLLRKAGSGISKVSFLMLFVSENDENHHHCAKAFEAGSIHCALNIGFGADKILKELKKSKKIFDKDVHSVCATTKQFLIGETLFFFTVTSL